MYRIAVLAVLTLAIASSGFTGELSVNLQTVDGRDIVDQEKLYYGGYGYILYFTDSDGDYYHDPGEIYYSYPKRKSLEL